MHVANRAKERRCGAMEVWPVGDGAVNGRQLPTVNSGPVGGIDGVVRPEGICYSLPFRAVIVCRA
jgi:hypothetical protein